MKFAWYLGNIPCLCMSCIGYVLACLAWACMVSKLFAWWALEFKDIGGGGFVFAVRGGLRFFSFWLREERNDEFNKEKRHWTRRTQKRVFMRKLQHAEPHATIFGSRSSRSTSELGWIIWSEHGLGPPHAVLFDFSLDLLVLGLHNWTNLCCVHLFPPASFRLPFLCWLIISFLYDQFKFYLCTQYLFSYPFYIHHIVIANLLGSFWNLQKNKINKKRENVWAF